MVFISEAEKLKCVLLLYLVASLHLAYPKVGNTWFWSPLQNHQYASASTIEDKSCQKGYSYKRHSAWKTSAWLRSISVAISIISGGLRQEN